MAMTLNVRINGPLEDFVAEKVGDEGVYENVSEYVRDLIRRDKEREEREAFNALKAELQRVFAKPDGEYVDVDRDAFLERLRARHG